jgi:DHA3 family macrolide efflux protein-like MFS transporter
VGVLSRYAGFRAVWVGQLLSQFGNAMFLIMGLWEIQLRSPFLLSIAGLALILPASLAVVGGAVVDRSDPRTIMLWTDVLRGLAVALGLLALAVHAALVVVIIVLLGLNSLGAAFFAPSEQVLIPWMVADEHLPAANGVYSLTSQVSQAVGSALGGAAIAAVGIQIVFGADLASFWLSALAIGLMMRVVAARPKPVAAERPEPGGGLLADLREGFRGLKTMPWLVALMPLILLTNLSFQAGFTMLPYWSRHMLGTGAVGYGLLNASGAVGMVLGSLSAGRFGRWPIRRVIALGGPVMGLATLAFAVTRAAVPAGGLFLLFGATNGLINALMFTIMQRLIPEAIRGRTFGFFITLITLASPLGALSAGVFLHVLPLWWSWSLAGVAAIAIGAAAWRILPEAVGAGDAGALAHAGS